MLANKDRANNKWSVENAQTNFDELLNKCIQSEPQIITQRGQDVAVLVAIDEWDRLQKQTRPSLKQLLLADKPRFDLPKIKRNSNKRRKIFKQK